MNVLYNLIISSFVILLIAYDEMNVFVVRVERKHVHGVAIGRFSWSHYGPLTNLLIHAVYVNKLVQPGSKTVRSAVIDALDQPELKQEADYDEQNVPTEAHCYHHDQTVIVEIVVPFWIVCWRVEHETSLKLH